jgi:MFS family permease
MSGLLQNSIIADIRPIANGINILLMNLFGSAIGPSIIGLISDYYNLKLSLMLVPISFIISSIIWLLGFCFIRVKAYQ